jgi:hypothetical protein
MEGDFGKPQLVPLFMLGMYHRRSRRVRDDHHRSNDRLALWIAHSRRRLVFVVLAEGGGHFGQNIHAARL